MLHAMIMAGGGGTRFWPRSRAGGPSSSSRSAATARCCRNRRPHRRAGAAGTDAGSSPAAAPCRGRRATAGLVPAIADRRRAVRPRHRRRASASGRRSSPATIPDATMMVTPADHVIEPEQEFRRAAHAAEQIANDFPDALITFGIPPTYPSTGYGYIHRGEQAGTRQGVPLSRVREFKEKPSRDRRRAVRGLAANTTGTAASSSGSRRRSSANSKPTSPTSTRRRAHRRGLGHAATGPRSSAPSTRRPRRSASTSR